MRRLPLELARQPGLRRQVVRFGVIGISATLTHVVIVLALVEGRILEPFGANVIAFSTALFVTYVGNHKWTFGLSGAHGRHFPRFILIALLGLGLNQGIVYLIVEGLRWDYRIALALVVTVVPAITFLLNRGWAFSHGPGTHPAP